MTDMAEGRSLIGHLIDALPEAIVVLDATDRVAAVNPTAQAMFPALRLGDLLVRGLRAPEVLDLVAQVRAGGEAGQAVFGERVPVERFLDVTVAPLKGSPQVVLCMRDFSEARRLERMRVDFVANASHELRTPLASLLGFIETLQGAARDDAQARGKFLDVMREQARRMARLVDDLLSLSRIEQHRHLAPATKVDLTGLVRHIADTLSPLARENEAVLRVDTPTSLDVVADRDELMRVVENLVENAIKYGCQPGDPTRSRVDISVSVERNTARLAVRDYGPGIPTEHLPRLTERFYRVDAATSRARGGTGLGLAIVKHIMARHRGRLIIDSWPGEGALFTITLPLHPSAMPREP